MEKEDEFIDLSQSLKNHYQLYQIQVNDENGEVKPIHLGSYKEIPLPVIKVIKYKEFVCHVVSYILTQDEINSKLYKIVGIHISKDENTNSLYSLDYIYNVDEKMFELILCNNTNDTVENIEKIDKFIGKDNIIEYIINNLFNGEAKKIFFK